jgi:hypothetical protein
MTSCSLPPRVGAVQPPWCLSILIPSPSSFIGSRPLTNFPLFFSFFSFLLFIFGLSRGFPVNCLAGRASVLGWVGSAFFSFWLNLASWLFLFFFKMANFYLFLIWCFLGCQISTFKRTLPDLFIGF